MRFQLVCESHEMRLGNEHGGWIVGCHHHRDIGIYADCLCSKPVNIEPERWEVEWKLDDLAGRYGIGIFIEGWNGNNELAGHGPRHYFY